MLGLLYCMGSIVRRVLYVLWWVVYIQSTRGTERRSSWCELMLWWTGSGCVRKMMIGMTPFLVHIVDITPWYILLVHDLTKFSKVLVDCSSVEALSSFGVKVGRFTKSYARVSFKKPLVPFGEGFFPMTSSTLRRRVCLLSGQPVSLRYSIQSHSTCSSASVRCCLSCWVAGRTMNAL